MNGASEKNFLSVFLIERKKVFFPFSSLIVGGSSSFLSRSHSSLSWAKARQGKDIFPSSSFPRGKRDAFYSKRRKNQSKKGFLFHFNIYFYSGKGLNKKRSVLLLLRKFKGDLFLQRNRGQIVKKRFLCRRLDMNKARIRVKWMNLCFFLPRLCTNTNFNVVRMMLCHAKRMDDDTQQNIVVAHIHTCVRVCVPCMYRTYMCTYEGDPTQKFKDPFKARFIKAPPTTLHTHTCVCVCVRSECRLSTIHTNRGAIEGGAKREEEEVEGLGKRMKMKKFLRITFSYIKPIRRFGLCNNASRTCNY